MPVNSERRMVQGLQGSQRITTSLKYPEKYPYFQQLLDDIYDRLENGQEYKDLPQQLNQTMRKAFQNIRTNATIEALDVEDFDHLDELYYKISDRFCFEIEKWLKIHWNELKEL